MRSVDDLVAVARDYITQGRRRIEAAEDVLPVAVGFRGDREIVIGLAGPCDNAQFTAALKALIDDGADAILFFSDTYLRDLHGRLIGEALNAYIEMRTGQRVTVCCRYTRAPLTFHEIAVTMDAYWVRPLFPVLLQ